MTVIQEIWHYMYLSAMMIDKITNDTVYELLELMTI